MNEYGDLSSADVRAVAAQLAAEPLWVGTAPAGQALGLPSHVILHAGPPLERRAIPQPIRNSAAMAALFEGWARSEQEAFALVASGAIDFCPAQDYRAVVPLASVLTAGMRVHVVTNAREPHNSAYAPLNGGSGPALRLGTASPAVVEHLRWLNGPLADFLNEAHPYDLPLIPLADEALSRGDDCHGRTIEATALLWRALRNTGRARQVPAAVEQFFKDGPSFFLNLWMAACKCMLSAAEGVEGSTVVVAIAGNGVDVAVKTARQPQRWVTRPATSPVGALNPGNGPEDCLGAIGDSAVVDAFGMGAMAMHHAPQQQESLGRFMPAPSHDLGSALFAGEHPRFVRSRIRAGLPATRVTREHPLAISLGIIHRAGERGRIGGGIYTPPSELFRAASEAG